MRKIHTVICLILILSGIATSAFAADIIRITNTVRNDGKIEKMIQISSAKLDYMSSENPLIPSDPVWKLSGVKKNGDLFLLEGTAVVEKGTKCLSFEDVDLEMGKDGIFTIFSYKASLDFSRGTGSSGKYQAMAYMINPFAREIAKKSNADPDDVSKAVNIAGFAIDKADELYRGIKLSDLVGSTEIHYKVNLPEPGILAGKKDLEPEASTIISGRELLRGGTTVTASSRFLPPALANALIIMIIFAALVIAGAIFTSAKRKKNLSALEDGE